VRQHLPNIITIGRLAALPFAASALLLGDRPLTLALVGFIALSDWLDGFLARRWNVQSAFGAVLDPLADKLTQLVLLALLAFGGRAEFGSIPSWLAGLVFARELFLVYGALRIRGRKGTVKIEALWAGKFSTALVFILLIVALLNAPQLWVDMLAWAAAPLVVLSGAQYARAGFQQVREG
jgi:CDP-diacylglycerol--glycerol-3-phosphate 3-phosphatidyltransferase